MKKLLLIDANSLIYRCFFALPPLTNSQGEPAGAIYGLSSILLKIFKESPPDYAAAAYDRPEPTFRKQAFENYKIQRPPMPDDLVLQLQETADLFRLFNIRVFEAPSFEADDIIATLARQFKKEKDLQIIILSGDLDTLQIVDNEKIVVWMPQKGVSQFTVYDEAAVLRRYGIQPSEMPDYKGLVGDKSDNIPGVAGIGPKTAAKIIQQFGRLEDFYELVPSAKAPSSVFQKLAAGKEKALLSKKLAVLRTDAPTNIEQLEECRIGEINRAELVDYFKNRGFVSLAGRF